jgi:mono/diheme cytochrome c family protein
MPAHRLIAFVPLILATVAPAAEVDFNREIKPILSNHCYACHGPDEEERQARLRLDTYEGATRNRRGRQAITPGNPDASTIIEHMTSTDPDEVMPPPDKGQPLSPEQIELIKKWITEGAHYAEHWSYTPVVRPEVPELASHPIDAFLLEELAANSLTFAPEADPHRLARRAAMDLTGLPPSPDEVDAFISDKSPDAYANYINRLLAKPAYGEHMARGWLDIARYADSAGYADDPPRTIWAYRDWVIRAYNSNMPFDRFTVAQLAGDLLPEATEDDLIATAFHRNTLTNSEGGTDDEEFRNAAVVDRVGTTFEAWMGTTMACAQCHTHKYDPITHEDYFRVFAIFNNTQDADRKDESPTIGILTPEQLRQQEEWQREKEKLAKVLESQTPELAAAQQAWESQLKEARPWTPAPAVSQSATDGVVLTPQADASLRATGEAPAASTYTIRIRPPAGQPLAAIRLEALADPELAQGGPGRNGNFVLSNLSARWIPQQATPPTARFVRIELTGAGKMIHLAEVEAFSNGINVARTGSARQSSTDFGGDVSRAIDGNTDGIYTANSVSHTAISTDPWIEVDLGANRPLDRVVLWNRTDGSTGERLQGYRIVLLDDARNPVWEEMPGQVPAPRSEFLLSGERSIKFSAAIATFEQDGFAAGEVLDAANLSGRGKGWAVGPKFNQSHELALTLAQPLPPEAGEIELTLAQQSPHTGHTLGRFRISTSADAAAVNDLLPDDMRAIVQREPGQRTPLEIDTLARYFQSTTSLLAEARERLAAVEKGLTEIGPATTVPVLREMPENQRRKTHIQLRGNFMNLGDPVEPGTPSAFPPLPEGTKADRLAFARWVVSPENPLTARATVNRLWEQVFGTGIVATTEEFGSQGDLPSHPKLLDWLAAEFVSSGWDTQHLLRLMVTSRAYRQTSRATPELLETDPGNRLLARGPSVRLTAEEIRDQALAASGLLSPTMFGPPVRPPRPSFGLVAAFGGTTDWVTSTGSDRYRRGVYTEIRRSMPHPSMTTFDATSREVCSLRRSRSNTPLQALVTLNDPAFVEAAQALARRLLRDHPDADPDQRLTIGFRLVIARPPSPPELAAMKKLLDQLLADYAATPDEALTFATNPIGPLPDGMKAVDLAAWTAVAQVLLNTDEAFQKY